MSTDPPEHDLPRVDTQVVPLLQVVVQKRRQQVVGRGHRVDVPREVQVDVLHGQHLGVAAPGRPSLHPEARPQGRLPQADHGRMAHLRQGLGEPDGRRGLPLTRRRGRRGRHQHQFPVRAVLQALHEVQVHFRLRFPIGDQRFLRDPRLSRDLTDRQQLRRVRDLDVRWYRHG